MLRRLGLVITAALLLAPAASYADSWSGPDPTGDAIGYGFDPEPPPCGTDTHRRTRAGDIGRLGVRHVGDDVTVTLDVTGLGRLTEISLDLPVRTARRSLEVQVDLRQGRPVRASLWSATQYGQESEPDECGATYVGGFSRGLACRGIDASFAKGVGRVTVTLPRTCVHKPRWVQAGAHVQGTLGDVVVLDTWQRPGTDTDSSAPQYGVRVRHSRSPR